MGIVSKGYVELLEQLRDLIKYSHNSYHYPYFGPVLKACSFFAVSLHFPTDILIVKECYAMTAIELQNRHLSLLLASPAIRTAKCVSKLYLPLSPGHAPSVALQQRENPFCAHTDISQNLFSQNLPTKTTGQTGSSSNTPDMSPSQLTLGFMS